MMKCESKWLKLGRNYTKWDNSNSERQMSHAVPHILIQVCINWGIEKPGKQCLLGNPLREDESKDINNIKIRIPGVRKHKSSKWIEYIKDSKRQHFLKKTKNKNTEIQCFAAQFLTYYFTIYLN